MLYMLLKHGDPYVESEHVGFDVAGTLIGNRSLTIESCTQDMLMIPLQALKCQCQLHQWVYRLQCRSNNRA